MKNLSWKNVPTTVFIGICLVLVGWLQAPRLINKAVEHGLSTVVENVMPSAVYVRFESDETNYRGQKISWQGSGVIVSKNGLILTARHVCEEPGKFTIILADGREFETTQACVCRDYDVGYLKIDDPNNDFPAAKFGDSDKMKLGSRVLAIGCPWGKEHFNSVTMGIISSLSRGGGEEVKDWGWEVLFQTDVAANPGNSGGAVFNTSGEIVGLVVGLYGPGHYAGITYCVPSNVCSKLVTTAQLAFTMNHVSIVEADERLNKFEGQLTEFRDDLRDIEDEFNWDVQDIEKRLEEVEEKMEEQDWKYYWDQWERNIDHTTMR